MSSLVKAGVFIAGVLVILVVALVILIQTQITPERVRETLLPLAEKKLNRKVDFGEIQIGLFSGISVSDLSVMQKDSEGDFVAVKAVKLNYRFFPLLTGKIVVDQILLDQPKIMIMRLADGRYNFSDLLSKPIETGTGRKTKNSENSPPADPPMFNLLVNEISINSGELIYVDRFGNPLTPFRYSLDNLNFKARKITYDNSFPIDLSALLNGSNVDISGSYNLSRRSGDLVIHLAPLDLVQFAPYYRDALPGKLGSALLSMNLEIDLQPDKAVSKGKIGLDQVDFVLTEFPEAALIKTQLGADYALTYDYEKKLLQFSTLLLKLNEIKVGAEGDINLSEVEPYIDLSIFLNQFDLREVMQNIPQGLTRKYQKYSFAGLVDGRADLSGKLNSGSDLLQSAQLNLSDVQASAENLRAAVSGDISFSERTVQSDNLVMNYADQKVLLTLKVENLFSDLAQGEFTLSAKELNLNRVMPEAATSSSQRSDQVNGSAAIDRGTKTAEEIGPINLPISLNGSLAIDRLIYKQLNFNRVVADINLAKNLLSIKNLSGQLAGGELKGESVIDLGVKGFAYQGQTALAQADMMTLVSGLLPQAKQSVTGKLQWRNSFSGRGTFPDKLLRSLDAKGEITLQGGTINGSPMLEQLAGFLGSEDVKVLSFQSLTGHYELQDGLTRFNGNLNSSKAKLAPEGSIALDGRLNLKLDARLAPDVMDKLGASKGLKQTMADQDGWGRLPLLIKGSLSSPQFSFDASALQKQAVEKTREQATRKLLEKVVPGSEEGKEPVRQLLDNTLNKLFGK